MKTFVIYIHLLATCVAMGVLLLQDFLLAMSRGKPLSVTAIAELRRSANIIFGALAVLWLSGLSLVLIGYLDNPQQYLLNEKLWAKFSVVMLLTLNGVALHYYSFPRVISPYGVMSCSNKEHFFIALTGSFSSVSWLFACYLGVARPWNYSVNYSYVMQIYLGLALFAFIVAYEAIRYFRKQELPLLAE